MLSRPILAARMQRSKWQTRGGRTFDESVQQRVRDILAAEPRNYLDADQEAELRRIEEAGLRGELVGRPAGPLTPKDGRSPHLGPSFRLPACSRRG